MRSEELIRTVKKGGIEREGFGVWRGCNFEIRERFLDPSVTEVFLKV